MKTELVTSDRFDAIERAAEKGGYTSAEVSLLTPNLQPAERAEDASYLVVDSAYTITILQLDRNGCPFVILERE